MIGVMIEIWFVTKFQFTKTSCSIFRFLVSLSGIVPGVCKKVQMERRKEYSVKYGTRQMTYRGVLVLFVLFAILCVIRVRF